MEEHQANLALCSFLLLEMHFANNVDSYPIDKKGSLQGNSSLSTEEFIWLLKLLMQASPFPYP